MKDNAKNQLGERVRRARRDMNLKQEELGFDIEYQITGQGMAKYKTEDSFVSRIVAVRK